MSELEPVEGISPAGVSDDAGPGVDASQEAAAAGSMDAFWQCGPGVHALDDPTPFGQENALQKLGKPPFEKTTRGRFRLLGYLATVYEHVSEDVARKSGLAPMPTRAPDAETAPEPVAEQDDISEDGDVSDGEE